MRVSSGGTHFRLRFATAKSSMECLDDDVDAVLFRFRAGVQMEIEVLATSYVDLEVLAIEAGAFGVDANDHRSRVDFRQVAALRRSGDSPFERRFAAHA